MKKIVLFGLACVMTTGAANAGLFDSLFGAKKEPATLEEACNTDEIKQICPEVLLGTKTITECVKENATNLSKQCASFIKKSISEKKEAIIEKAIAAQSETAAAEDAAKSAIAEKKEGIVAAVIAAKSESDAKNEAAKADMAAKKAAVQEAASETAAAARQTGESLKATGGLLKSMF